MGVRVLGVEYLPFDLPVAPSWSELGPQADAGTQSPQTCPRTAAEPGLPQAGGRHCQVPLRVPVLGAPRALGCAAYGADTHPTAPGHLLLPWAVYEAPLSCKRTPRCSIACTHGHFTPPARTPGSLTLRQILHMQPRRPTQAGHREWRGFNAWLPASLVHQPGL